jgi:hypothetical protein
METMEIIFRKDVFFGDTLTIQELLTALKNEAFTDDEDCVTVTTEENHGMISAMYFCKSCNRLHIIANDYNEDKEPMFKETDIIELLNDVSSETIAKNVILSKKEVIEALEKVEDKSLGVTIETILDGTTYTLTRVLKCKSECTIPHLHSYYEENHTFAN